MIHCSLNFLQNRKKMTSSRRHHLKVKQQSDCSVTCCSMHNHSKRLCWRGVSMLLRLQSLILQIALNWLEQEKKDNEVAKAAYMAENCPSPDLSGDQAALMVRAVKVQLPFGNLFSLAYQLNENGLHGQYCVGCQLCVCMSSGNLQEASRPHWQDRWGQVRHRGQSEQGWQRGKLFLTESHHKDLW